MIILAYKVFTLSHLGMKILVRTEINLGQYQNTDDSLTESLTFFGKLNTDLPFSLIFLSTTCYLAIIQGATANGKDRY